MLLFISYWVCTFKSYNIFRRLFCKLILSSNTISYSLSNNLCSGIFIFWFKDPVLLFIILFIANTIVSKKKLSVTTMTIPIYLIYFVSKITYISVCYYITRNRGKYSYSIN